MTPISAINKTASNKITTLKTTPENSFAIFFLKFTRKLFRIKAKFEIIYVSFSIVYKMPICYRESHQCMFTKTVYKTNTDRYYTVSESVEIETAILPPQVSINDKI